MTKTTTPKTTRKKSVEKNTVQTEPKSEVKVQPKVNNPSTRDNDSDKYSLKTAELDFDNEVYDEGDIASALEMGFIAQALEAHKSKVAPESHPDFDGETCIDCGDDIPEVRLAMGRIRCVYCQELLEKKNKMRG